jgi:hypothetical protein
VPTITLEEHFSTADFLEATGQVRETNARLEELIPRLLDVGDGRIADMDASGIDLQVLSLSSAGLDKLDAATATALVHDINDRLADAVSAHPDRFAAFATVALQEPEKGTKAPDQISWFCQHLETSLSLIGAACHQTMKRSNRSQALPPGSAPVLNGGIEPLMAESVGGFPKASN